MNGVPPILSPDEIFDEVERQYMPIVFDKIKARSVEIANSDGRKEPTYVDIFRAFEEKFGPRNLIVMDKTSDNSIWRENLFLIIVVIMTLGFGLMGLLPYLSSVDVNKLGYKPDVFLDIAKIFAGVVVGGAAGAAAGAATATGRRGKSG